MLFLTVLLACGGVFVSLLWFTGWAEQRVIDPKAARVAPPVEADTH